MKRIYDLMNDMNFTDLDQEPLLPVSRSDKKKILAGVLRKTGIHSPDSLRTYQSKYFKNNLDIKRSFKKGLLIAAIITALTLTVSANDSIISLFNKLFKETSYIVNKYNYEVNASATQNGITFTIESVLRDDVGLYFFYKIVNNNNAFRGYFVQPLSINVSSPQHNGKLNYFSENLFGKKIDAATPNIITGMILWPESKWDNNVRNLDITLKDIVTNSLSTNHTCQYDFIKYLLEHPELNSQSLINSQFGSKDVLILKEKGLDIPLLSFGYNKYFIDNLGIIDGKFYIKIINRDYAARAMPLLTLTDGINTFTPDMEKRTRNKAGAAVADYRFDIQEIGDPSKLSFVIKACEILDDIRGEWHISFDIPSEKAPSVSIKPKTNIVLWDKELSFQEIKITPVSVYFNLISIDILNGGIISDSSLSKIYANVVLKDGTTLSGEKYIISNTPTDDWHFILYLPFFFEQAFEFNNIKEIVLSDTEDFSHILISIDPSKCEIVNK